MTFSAEEFPKRRARSFVDVHGPLAGAQQALIRDIEDHQHYLDDVAGEHGPRISAAIRMAHEFLEEAKQNVVAARLELGACTFVVAIGYYSAANLKDPEYAQRSDEARASGGAIPGPLVFGMRQGAIHVRGLHPALAACRVPPCAEVRS